MRYVVCYDTPSVKRRNQLARRLESLGFRVQYSVFECDLTPDLLAMAETAIAEVVDQYEDKVLIYPVCESCAGKIRTIGVASRPHTHTPLMIY